jgi:hypothetical protein
VTPPDITGLGLALLALVVMLSLRARAAEQAATTSMRLSRGAVLADVSIVVGTLPALALFWMGDPHVGCAGGHRRGPGHRPRPGPGGHGPVT